MTSHYLKLDARGRVTFLYIVSKHAKSVEILKTIEPNALKGLILNKICYDIDDNSNTEGEIFAHYAAKYAPTLKLPAEFTVNYPSQPVAVTEAHKEEKKENNEEEKQPEHKAQVTVAPQPTDLTEKPSAEDAEDREAVQEIVAGTILSVLLYKALMPKEEQEPVTAPQPTAPLSTESNHTDVGVTGDAPECIVP